MEVKAENGTITLKKVVQDVLQFTGMFRPDAMLPTRQAAQAKRVLSSLQQNQPIQLSSGATAVSNPVTNTFGSIKPTDKGSEVAFSTKRGLSRPKGPQSQVQQLGVRATVNQVVDQIPTARNNPDNLDARYTFEAIQDEKDIIKNMKQGKAPGSANQRAIAYERMTKGAFKAYPKADVNELDLPEWRGYGERIDQTRWQPRDASGRYGKYVNFDPTEPVKRLGKIAAQFGAVKYVPQIGKVVQAIQTVDDLAEAAFGVRPSQKIVEEQQKQVSKTVSKRPDYNLGPILPF